MYGVADYRNYTDGGNYTAYGVNLDQPFTYDVNDVETVINGLATGDGADLPESQLKAMVSITSNWLTTAGDLGFSGRSGAQKIIIWAGDAPGHISGDEGGSSGAPPSGYYPTLDAVIDALTAQGIIVFALNSADSEHGLNEPYDGVDQYHKTPPPRQQASEITAATGGTLFNNVGSGSSEIEDAIVAAIRCYSFEKDDDLNDANSLDCKSPNQELTYSICLTNDSDQTLTDVHIVDRLPSGVDIPISYTLDPNTWEMIPSDPNYDPNTHEYIWSLDPIAPAASVCVSLTVTVNANAAPGGYLHNVAELWGTILVPDPNDPNIVYPETRLVAIAVKDTPICCWMEMPDVLYVDKNAVNGANNGLDWANAFTDLQSALEYARSAVCGQVQSIYCAQGIYSPGDDENDTFELLPNLSLYGGFPTDGCDFSLRNPKRYQTTLTGYIDSTHRNAAIVTVGDEILLDGFTISNADIYGIFSDGKDFSAYNCIVEKNEEYGIYIEDGNAYLEWCTIRNNKRDGIYHQGEGFELTVSNCWIRQSNQYGVRCINATPIIFNSVITESDLAREGRAGIRLVNPTFSPFLLNNTIAHNKGEGISLVGSTLPEIENCIVYHNNSGGPQLAGFTADQAASYCCIADCNEVNNNINDDPEFAYFDPNNVRITANSPCHDSGLTLQENYSQVDMDNRDRVLGNAVDRGAYEIECEDTSNSYDLNADGLVNLVEFNGLSKAWLSHDPNDPAWLADPNLRDPNLSDGWYEWKYKYNFEPTGNSQYSIDLADLMTFLEDAPWLWKACWLDLEEMQAEQMSGGIQQQQMLASLSFEQPMALSSDVIGTEEVQAVPEPAVQPELSVEEQIIQLQDTIGFLEQIWLEEPDIQAEISLEDWQEFMNAVNQSLLELQTETVQSE